MKEIKEGIFKESIFKEGVSKEDMELLSGIISDFVGVDTLIKEVTSGNESFETETLKKAILKGFNIVQIMADKMNMKEFGVVMLILNLLVAMDIVSKRNKFDTFPKDNNPKTYN